MQTPRPAPDFLTEWELGGVAQQAVLTKPRDWDLCQNLRLRDVHMKPVLTLLDIPPTLTIHTLPPKPLQDLG